tara:strand:- start:487 stop:1380 length:894 start_codon:yes stop_codon:yes gene_type:complete
MSIKTEAIIVRDETSPKANTALRIGSNLVSIAEALEESVPYEGADKDLNLGDNSILLGGKIEVDATSISVDETIGLDVKIAKENTSVGGSDCKVKGLVCKVSGNSSEEIGHVIGIQSEAEHTGSKETRVQGINTMAKHNGSGDTTAVYGIYTESNISGNGVGNHEYVMNVYRTRVDNPNARVKYLQGIHASVMLGEGEVYRNASCLYLDFYNYGGGTITGDFDHLKISNEPIPMVGNGTARAINSLTTLPSVFAGSVQSAGLSDSAITEHADNAAAIAAGLSVGVHYRTGDLLKIVH